MESSYVGKNACFQVARKGNTLTAIQDKLIAASRQGISRLDSVEIMKPGEKWTFQPWKLSKPGTLEPKAIIKVLSLVFCF